MIMASRLTGLCLQDENGNALEEAWLQLLASWAVDYRKTLFDLVASVKWVCTMHVFRRILILLLVYYICILRWL